MSRTGTRLLTRAGLALVGVVLLGRYITDHPTAIPSPAPPAHAAPAAAGAIQAQARAMFGPDYSCAANIISHESSWNPHALNAGSGAYGLPQALPGDKMAAAGPDWRDNPATQLAWMKTYVDTRYGGACPAWQWWAGHHWY